MLERQRDSVAAVIDIGVTRLIFSVPPARATNVGDFDAGIPSLAPGVKDSVPVGVRDFRAVRLALAPYFQPSDDGRVGHGLRAARTMSMPVARWRHARNT